MISQSNLKYFCHLFGYRGIFIVLNLFNGTQNCSGACIARLIIPIYIFLHMVCYGNNICAIFNRRQ